MFDKASRLKLRFQTPAGQLSVEDLWDLPLSSATGKANLDNVAKELWQKLKQNDVPSFVARATGTDDVTQLKFDVVKHIIDIRLAESDQASAAKANKEKKQQILAIIAQKQNEALGAKSIDELTKLAESF